MCNKSCKTQKVILDGKDIVIRKPRMRDDSSLLRFVNSLVKEDAMIGVNRASSLKEERKWLKENLEKIKKNKKHQFVAQHKNEIIGEASVTKKDYRQSHVASFTISIKNGFRNIGLGTKLTRVLIDVATKDPEIKIFYLDVLANNKGAIRLYQRLGFRKAARLPKRLLYKGKYIDQITMDYPLKKI